MTKEESTRPQRPRRRRGWLALGVLVLILIAIIVAWCGYTWHRLNDAPLPIASAGAVFVVEKGESLASLSHRLASRGVLEHAWDLQVLARLRGVSDRIQAGEYRVPAGITVKGLLKIMVAGKVVMHAFTIVPGETFAQIRA
ncbi:MAG: endolytic transglycosylase MltG, partial [Gammaproteobacteria bacterium]